MPRPAVGNQVVVVQLLPCAIWPASCTAVLRWRPPHPPSASETGSTRASASSLSGLRSWPRRSARSTASRPAIRLRWSHGIDASRGAPPETSASAWAHAAAPRGQMMHNVPAFFEVFWGCLHAGLTVAPLNAKLHAKEIAFCLGRSSARAVFADGKLQSTVEDAVEQAGGTSSGVSLLRVGDEQWRAPCSTGHAEPGRRPAPLPAGTRRSSRATLRARSRARRRTRCSTGWLRWRQALRRGSSSPLARPVDQRRRCSPTRTCARRAAPS